MAEIDVLGGRPDGNPIAATWFAHETLLRHKPSILRLEEVNIYIRDGGVAHYIAPGTSEKSQIDLVIHDNLS